MTSSPLLPYCIEGEDDRTLQEAFAFLDDWQNDGPTIDFDGADYAADPIGQDLGSAAPSLRPTPTPSVQAKDARRTTAVRQKTEIRHLRQKAVELKMRADFLRLLRDSRQLLTGDLSRTAGHIEAVPFMRATMAKIWMDTALRQKKLRVASELENERLRDAVEHQRKMLASIRNMIKRHARNERPGSIAKQPIYTTVSGITSRNEESMRAIEKTCLRIESALFATANSELSTCTGIMGPRVLGPQILQISATKVCVTFNESRTMPFALQDVGRVMWAMMTERCLEQDQFFEQRSIKRHEVWVRDYEVHHRVANRQIKLIGESGIRRRHEDHRIAYTFAGASEPFEINGESVAGISMREQGCVVISRSAAVPSTDACQLEFTLQVDIDVNASSLRPYAQLVAEVITSKYAEQFADMMPEVESALLLGHT